LTKKKRIAILGSTGSIGRQALDVIAAHPEMFEVCGIAANAQTALIAQQAQRFRPEVVSAGSELLAREVELGLGGKTRGMSVFFGDAGLRAVSAESGADLVLAATDGMVASGAVFAAVERGIDVALANKEIAVSAGEPLFAASKRSGARIIPVDSEHSAILQCLAGERPEHVRTVVVTASGGPCWDLSIAEMTAVTPDQALRHPTWAMGAKNTLDSATLMNKGLEVIEATRFFALAPEQLEVVVQRQSVMHAFVFFVDGSVKAQLAAPDMRLPIGFALSYPERLPGAIAMPATRRAMGLEGGAATLTFEPVDHERFPALRLAYAAVTRGKTYPAVLSASNEEAGRAFLQGKVRFVDIAALVAAALDAHTEADPTLPGIEEADRWARAFTRDAVSAKAAAS
jgi:1-deoxy-D-xylulose-5-phosphate reductoisomerase